MYAHMKKDASEIYSVEKLLQRKVYYPHFMGKPTDTHTMNVTAPSGPLGLTLSFPATKKKEEQISLMMSEQQSSSFPRRAYRNTHTCNAARVLEDL